MQKCQTKRVKILLKKTKQALKTYKSMTSFKEPVLFLIRRSGRVEFHENAKKTLFDYTHSDGVARFIILHPSKILTFDYGRKTFRGYMAHEDHPLALPEEPTITAEQMNITIEKTLNDVRKWKAEELKARGDMWWKIITGLAIIIALFVVYQMVKPNAIPTPADTTITTTIADNVSRAITILR